VCLAGTGRRSGTVYSGSGWSIRRGMQPGIRGKKLGLWAGGEGGNSGREVKIVLS